MKNKANKEKTFSEIIRYGIAGVTTTLVNLGLYHVLLSLGIDYKITNLIAIIGSKMYGYIVNKLFVFKSYCTTRKELFIEIGKFIGARGITGIIDYFGVIMLVVFFGFDKFLSKYGITTVVIMLNYLFGRFLIFKNVSGEE